MTDSLLFAIDPGTTESAWLLYNLEYGTPLEFRKEANERVLERVYATPATHFAIETIQPMGMTVGAEVFETCFWTGRFMEAWTKHHYMPVMRVKRGEVKLFLCGSMRAKDPNVRQALIDRYGPGKAAAIGLKKSPGPLYGMAGDCWAALGVAVTAAEREEVA